MNIDYLIPYFIPLGLVVVALEVLISVKEKEDLYEWKDTLSSGVMGLGATLVGALTKAGILALFVFFFELFRPLRTGYLGYASFGWAWWVWLVCMVCDDFTFYWHHRFNHSVRVFWAAHVVHHSSERFNFGAAFRNGWVIYFYKPFLWIWMPIIGFEPGMVLTAISINAIYQFLLHSKKVPHLGVLEKIFNTPQLHQLHHSRNIEFLDKNHGGILILWDRLFGTYHDSRNEVKREFGVLSPPNSYNPWIIFSHEYQNLWKDVRRAPTWQDKLRYIFYPPGWSHDNSRMTARQMQRQLHLQRQAQPAGEPGPLVPQESPQ
ncbi:MAG: sterol desaturase family protein [Cytophagales bacterium]|nr:sterol desaturase family protein [Cytophagales bacterium]